MTTPVSNSDSSHANTVSHANTTAPAVPRVLSIAGTDPTGGAGLQADLKSIAAAGGFGMSAVTALVSQNTHGVQSVLPVDQDFLRQQLTSVSEDVTVDAIKIGMLSDATTVKTVATALQQIRATGVDPVVVLDPVMVASSGDRLLDQSAEQAVREFIADVDVITPNLPELAVLADTPVATTLDEAIGQAKGLASENKTTVIVKGGHLDGATADNAVVTPEGQVDRVASTRVNTKNTHGTGCSLSSALATKLAAGETPGAALRWSTRWLHEAIENADALQVGSGNGPVDHSHRARRLETAASTKVWPHLLGELPEGKGYAKAPTPKLKPAGPHTQRLWELTGEVWQEIMELPFIRGLRVGTLPKEDFNFYLSQDALYLNRYSRALAMLSAIAPDADAQIAWAESAAECIAGEAELHRTWLSGFSEQDATRSPVSPSPTTLAYTNFLIATAATEPYVCGVAGVLPCFWLYAEIGIEVTTDNHADHPFKPWIDTYGDQHFIDGAQAAIERMEVAWEAANEEERRQATDAYLNACIYEREFFDQADRAW